MADETPLTDDYVAELLRRDAKAVSSRTSAGLTGSLSKRPASSARPNTRFLRNILRDTDAHNSALLAREEQESRARLQSLDPARKRRRTDRRSEQQLYSVRATRDQSQRTSDVSLSARHSHRTPGAVRSRDSRARSRRDERGETDVSTKRMARERSRSASPRQAHRARRQRSSSASQMMHDKGSSRAARSPSASESSVDIGPQPLEIGSESLNSRGRVADQNKTVARDIDAHFAQDYDPSMDVRIRDDDSDVQTQESGHAVVTARDEEDDWARALAALRDRQKHIATNGPAGKTARLQAAGFARDEDHDASVVKWARSGEQREWDRGKSVVVEK